MASGGLLKVILVDTSLGFKTMISKFGFSAAKQLVKKLI